MTSPKQRAANAKNARKARGPVSVKGKAISSRNAIKHGLNQMIDPLTHQVLTIIKELYIEEGIDPVVARNLAQAHVERERVRRARIEIWRSEYHTQDNSDCAEEVDLHILNRQLAINRYEVRAVSQLSKAARAAFLPLPKPAKARRRKPIKRVEEL